MKNTMLKINRRLLLSASLILMLALTGCGGTVQDRGSDNTESSDIITDASEDSVNDDIYVQDFLADTFSWDQLTFEDAASGGPDQIMAGSLDGQKCVEMGFNSGDLYGEDYIVYTDYIEGFVMCGFYPGQSQEDMQKNALSRGLGQTPDGRYIYDKGTSMLEFYMPGHTSDQYFIECQVENEKVVRITAVLPEWFMSYEDAVSLYGQEHVDDEIIQCYGA